MSSRSISSQSSTKSIAHQGPLGRCCASLRGSYNHCTNETVAGGAISEEYGALFNLLFGHVMFWAIGLPTVLDHGYDESRNGDNGSTPSGENGSGVFIVTLILMIIATFIFAFKMVNQCENVRKQLEARRAAQAAHEAKLAKLRDAARARSSAAGAATAAQ